MGGSRSFSTVQMERCATLTTANKILQQWVPHNTSFLQRTGNPKYRQNSLISTTGITLVHKNHHLWWELGGTFGCRMTFQCIRQFLSTHFFKNQLWSSEPKPHQHCDCRQKPSSYLLCTSCHHLPAAHQWDRHSCRRGPLETAGTDGSNHRCFLHMGCELQETKQIYSNFSRSP